MKRIASFTLTLLATLFLAGCPSGTNQQKIAQAAQDASQVVLAFQQGEIVAHQSGSISDADHEFIQEQLVTVSTLGKTTDSCIRTATTTAGTIQCANTAISTIDNLNTQGALHIKSTQAKTDFSIAMLGLRTALATIVTLEGGTAPPVAVSSTGGL